MRQSSDGAMIVAILAFPIFVVAAGLYWAGRGVVRAYRAVSRKPQ